MEFHGFCEKGFEDLLQNIYIQQDPIWNKTACICPASAMACLVPWKPQILLPWSHSIICTQNYTYVPALQNRNLAQKTFSERLKILTFFQDRLSSGLLLNSLFLAVWNWAILATIYEHTTWSNQNHWTDSLIGWCSCKPEFFLLISLICKQESQIIPDHDS
jgi:hypothetical protein